MDVIFGTHHCPDHEPEAFGHNEPGPRTYLGHMIRPLFPRKGPLAHAARDGEIAREELAQPHEELVSTSS